MLKKRNTWIDALRGIGIVIVLIGHAIQCNLTEFSSGGVLWERIILPVQMPLLFFVSGMTFSYSIPINENITFIVKKIKRLMIPYCMWAYIHYIIVCFLNTSYRTFSFAGVVEEFIKSDFWFLRYLFFIFIICGMIDLIVKMMGQVSCLTYVKVYIILLLLFVPIVEIISRSYYGSLCIRTWYYLCFVIGVIFAVALDYFEPHFICAKKLKTIGRVCLSCLILSIVVFLNILLPEKIVCIILLIETTILTLIIGSVENSFTRCISEIGRNTLPIYAIHWCLLFSPLWRIKVYTNTVFGELPFNIRVIITALLWWVITNILMQILRKSKLLKSLLFGEV